jgi:hypothetical protein
MEPSPQIDGKFAFGVGRHEMKGWSHNRLLMAIPFCFKGLYLMRKREETKILSGIALALSVNRKMISQQGQSQVSSGERKK